MKSYCRSHIESKIFHSSTSGQQPESSLDTYRAIAAKKPSTSHPSPIHQRSSRMMHTHKQAYSLVKVIHTYIHTYIHTLNDVIAAVGAASRLLSSGWEKERCRTNNAARESALPAAVLNSRKNMVKSLSDLSTQPIYLITYIHSMKTQISSGGSSTCA